MAIYSLYENSISRENLCDNEVYKTFSTDTISVFSIRETLRKSFVVGLLLQIINQTNGLGGVLLILLCLHSIRLKQSLFQSFAILPLILYL